MVKDTEYYDILKLHPTSSNEDIKKAYRKLALEHHPDKGGNGEYFKKINTAYDTLKNTETRYIYDKMGKQGNSVHGQADDMFANIFGSNPFGTMFGMFSDTINKTVQTVVTQTVTLEQLCKREVINITYNLFKQCSVCANITGKCDNCDGLGYTSNYLQISPVLVQNIRSMCGTCSGRGLKRGCSLCKSGLVSASNTIPVHLTPDMKDGYVYVVNKMGSETIDGKKSDLAISIIYLKHPLFVVESNSDITCRCSISLKEALVGYTKTLIHPTGALININTSGQVLNQSTIFVVEGKGMTDSGSFRLLFDIVFPDSLTLVQVKDLENIL